MEGSGFERAGDEPNCVRRWFKQNLGMTFQGYLRTFRISQAFDRIKHGEKVIDASYNSGYESLSGFTDSFKKQTGFSFLSSHQNQILKITRILTPLGFVLAGATEKGIGLLEFADRRMLETQLKRIKKIFKAKSFARHFRTF